MFLLLLSATAFAEDMWAKAPTDGVRWPDVATVSVTLAEGDKVEALVKDGDKVRIRKGTDFGWVAASSLTDVEPPKPPVEEIGGDFPNFTLPGAEDVTPAE